MRNRYTTAAPLPGRTLALAPHEKLPRPLQGAYPVYRGQMLVRGRKGWWPWPACGVIVFARLIHNAGPRASMPMVMLNCAALPESLLESELFGHEKGAFTGAMSRKIGRFELADRGTFFLDEIGEMPVLMQAKLLHVLQNGVFYRVGGVEPISVDVRVIAATNRDIAKEVAEDRFREDLYYRLNVVQIRMPALRERREDIPLLAAYFLEVFRVEAGLQSLTISGDSMEKMVAKPQRYHAFAGIRGQPDNGAGGAVSSVTVFPNLTY